MIGIIGIDALIVFLGAAGIVATFALVVRAFLKKADAETAAESDEPAARH